MKGLIRPITFKVKENVTTLALLVFTNLSFFALVDGSESKYSTLYLLAFL